MSDYFDRLERQLVRKVETGVRRRTRIPVRLEHLAVAASVLVVIAVVAVFVVTRGRGTTGGPAPGRTVRIRFSVSRLDPRTPLQRSVEHSVQVLRQRLDAVFQGVRVSRAGGDVVVSVPKAAGVSRERIVALAVPARLEFYDWEANALTANGSNVASRLNSQDAAAVRISQGNSALAPGEPGAGSLPLYEAVKLAFRQQPLANPVNARSGPLYYLFAAPGSRACQTTARDRGDRATATVHCLLAGPASTAHALDSSLPAGVSASQGQRLKVPQGMVVLQAMNATAAQPTPLSSPTAQFYVLKDNVALSGADITNPSKSTDQTGSPDVTFAFSSAGAHKFQSVTARIARRGANISRFGQMLNQHFAVALDNQLVTVPSIDFRNYPDGISGGTGADIVAGFTPQSARTLATLLRYGPLSVDLAAR